MVVYVMEIGVLKRCAPTDYLFCSTWACVLVCCWVAGGARLCYPQPNHHRYELPLDIDWKTADIAKHRAVYQDNWFDLVKQ